MPFHLHDHVCCLLVLPSPKVSLLCVCTHTRAPLPLCECGSRRMYNVLANLRWIIWATWASFTFCIFLAKWWIWSNGKCSKNGHAMRCSWFSTRHCMSGYDNTSWPGKTTEARKMNTIVLHGKQGKTWDFPTTTCWDLKMGDYGKGSGPPHFDGKNYNMWEAQMGAFLRGKGKLL